MISKVLVELQRFNQTQKKLSWSNYQEFLRILLSTTQTDEAKELLSYLEKSDFTSLVVCAERIASTEYPTPTLHRLNVQLSSVIRKYPFPKGHVAFDPEREALKKFFAAEHMCSRVNQRFACYRKVRSPHEQALDRARSWIRYVLGDFNLSLVTDDCDFGAGASLGVHGNATNSARKLLAKSWSVSPGAYYYAMAALKKDWHILETLNGEPDTPFVSVDVGLFNQRFTEKARMVDYNNISFVPKTVKTHRAIAVEPILNGYLQKGVDVFLRKRLKRVGIDLSDQTKNQELSRQGSEHWTSPDAFCTIDLSSASDSLSTELCRYLLPPDWFDYLNSIRSHSYKLEGVVRPYHKFVSMGNGFCFPLESLIFASLCISVNEHAAAGQDFLVYGDDIVIRRGSFDPLLKLLKVCGFRVNAEKTFSQGPFRESCGADWFEGKDVRPIILDYELDSFQNIAKFCNIIKSKGIWEDIFAPARDFLLALVPRKLLLCRPYRGNSDSAIEVPWDVFMASPFSRYSRKTMSWSWVELCASATPDKRVKRFARYNIALMRGALTGVSSPNPFTERYSSRTKVRRICPGGATSTLEGYNFLSLVPFAPTLGRYRAILSG